MLFDQKTLSQFYNQQMPKPKQTKAYKFVSIFYNFITALP
jgi:hypothetical protein